MVSRVRVRHSTTFVYADVVHASFNEARISPLDTPSQFTIEHRVEVHPAANLFRYRDYWGSRVHAFDLHGPHRELTVVGTSVVETSDRSPSIDFTVNWDTLGAPGLTDRLFEYLSETPMTAANDAVLEVADNLRRAPTPGDALAGLGPWIRDHVVYEPGATNVSTTAVEVLAARRGVCQDFAHLALAVLRAAGIPAGTRPDICIPRPKASSPRPMPVRVTRGSKPGWAIGIRSIPRVGPRSASAT